LEDPHQGLRAVFLAWSTILDVIWQAVHCGITILGCLELSNLVCLSPFLDLDNFGLVFIGEEISDLLVALGVHNKQANDVVSGVLGGRR